MDLSGTVALVTGASSGIGEATARALADEGCEVVLAARRETRLETIANEIGRERAHPIPTDVTKESEIDALMEKATETFGGIDVLVASAGVLVREPTAEQSRADLRRQVEVNLLGLMNVTHAVLPSMLDSGGGDIVAISSMNARNPAGGVYSATKFGVNGFCRGLRKEVSDAGVRITTLMPGPVVTEMRDWEDWDGRALDPSEVAAAVVFAVTRPDHVTLLELPVHSTDRVSQ
jgi:NADP-dependent 3-hydroxy acid dehydrogenase YdfG